MIEAFKIFLWSLSAVNDGKLMEACKPKIIFSDPYLTLSVGKGNE
jgi:hypothetical protein